MSFSSFFSVSLYCFLLSHSINPLHFELIERKLSFLALRCFSFPKFRLELLKSSKWLSSTVLHTPWGFHIVVLQRDDMSEIKVLQKLLLPMDVVVSWNFPLFATIQIDYESREWQLKFSVFSVLSISRYTLMAIVIATLVMGIGFTFADRELNEVFYMCNSRSLKKLFHHSKKRENNEKINGKPHIKQKVVN